jgi:hypothetical protein
MATNPYSVSHGDYGTPPSWGGNTYSQPFGSYNYSTDNGGYGTPYGGGFNPSAGDWAQQGQSNPFSDPYARNSYFSQNPYAAFGEFQSSLPGGFTNPYSRYLQQNYSTISNQYQADLVNNPYQSMNDYLQRMNPQLQSQYSNLSPMQRGESPQMAGRSQYVGF